MPRQRLLAEHVTFNHNFRSGETLESNNPEDGCIMSFTSLNHTFFYSEDQKELILKLDCLQQDSSLQLILTFTEEISTIFKGAPKPDFVGLESDLHMH